MTSVLFLILGIALAFFGGELFLRGVLGISDWLRIPSAVTAATLAAFATSSPEVAVSVNAALLGHPQIALGDALGSNVVNVGLILGLVLCIGPLAFEWKKVRREFLFALSAPLVIGFALLDGSFARWEALACLAVFSCWLGMALREALQARKNSEPTEKKVHGFRAILLSIGGLSILILAGRWIVSGGTGVGEALGMDSFLIGATMVAFGTSAPELATAVLSKWKGHDDVGIGTILGSNIFNCFFIIGLTGMMQPFEEPLVHVLGSILFGLATVVTLIPSKSTTISWGRGLTLLFLYFLSIVAIGYSTTLSGH